MKTLFLFIIFSSFICSAQDFSNLESIPLNNSEDCKKAQPKVIESANYLLTTPAYENLNGLNATSFILAWMEKTPDYTFDLGGDLFMSISSDTNLVSRYMAAQAMVAIETGSIVDKTKFKFDYTSKFLNYCEKPENKVKLNSKMKKYIKAKNENNLPELLAKE